jgi:hypothetical protein
MKSSKLIGKKFGKLTIDNAGSFNGRIICDVTCECGTKKTVYWSNLSSGGTQSCGCAKRELLDSPLIFVGARFERLEIIDIVFENNRKMCVVRCDCGTEKKVQTGSLLSGKVKSCGCLKKEMDQKRIVPVELGQRFGRLVVRRIRQIKGEFYCYCKCDCGENVVVAKSALTRKANNTQSCGCYRDDRTRETSRTHGLSKERLYNLCIHARMRVVQNLRGYGEVGIEESWKDDIEKMYYDLKPIYDRYARKYGEENISIDRIDNSKGYFKGNIGFTTKAVQSDNRGPRNDQKCFEAVNIVTGEKYCCNNLHEFERRFGVKANNIHSAMNRGGFSGDFHFRRIDTNCYPEDQKKLESGWRRCLKEIT